MAKRKKKPSTSRRRKIEALETQDPEYSPGLDDFIVISKNNVSGKVHIDFSDDLNWFEIWGMLGMAQAEFQRCYHREFEGDDLVD